MTEPGNETDTLEELLLLRDRIREHGACYIDAARYLQDLRNRAKVGIPTDKVLKTGDTISIDTPHPQVELQATKALIDLAALVDRNIDRIALASDNNPPHLEIVVSLVDEIDRPKRPDPDILDISDEEYARNQHMYQLES